MKIKNILLVFLIWRGLIFLSAYLGSLIFTFKGAFPYADLAFLKYSKNIFFWPWANFDGVHYLYIAEKGYAGFEQAFFPLYPLLIRWFSFLFSGNYLFSGLFISHGCFLVSLFLLYKLVKLDYDNNTAKWTLLFLIFFPTSFFFGSVYTESLFLMLVLLSFYGARTNKWWLAGVSGMLASATRAVGIFLLPALIVEYLQQRKKNYKLYILNYKFLSLFLIPLGLLTYMFCLLRATGDSLMFIHSQPAFGANRSGGQLIFLPQVFFRYLKILIYSQHNFQYFISILELIMILSFLFLVILSFFKLRQSYFIFSFLCLIAPTLTGTFSSVPRYVLTLFPCFILLGMIKKREFKFLLLITNCLLLIVFTILFTRGLFIS